MTIIPPDIPPAELAAVLRSVLATVDPYRTRLEELCAGHLIEAAGWAGDEEYLARTNASGMRELLVALADVGAFADTYDTVARRPEVMVVETAVRIAREAAANE